jgi:hypothetical protein
MCFENSAPFLKQGNLYQFLHIFLQYQKLFDAVQGVIS